MKRLKHPKVFRNHMLMREGLDYKIVDGRIMWKVRMRKGQTYTVYWFAKSYEYELYNSEGQLVEEGVLTL